MLLQVCLVVFGVWFCDYIVHVDDPVGAVAVHLMNGIWGTIAVGLFATTELRPLRGYGDGTYGANQIAELVFSMAAALHSLGLQLLGMLLSVAAWTAVTITIDIPCYQGNLWSSCFSEEEEIVGLDATEHGLPSAYAGFSVSWISTTP